MDIAQQTSRSVPTLGAEAVAICRLEQAGSDVRALSEVVGGCNPTQHDMNEQRAPKTPLTPSHFTVSFLREDLAAARSEASPFHGVAAPASEGWWSSSYKGAQRGQHAVAAKAAANTAPAHAQRAEPREGDPAHSRASLDQGWASCGRAGSRVMSDEEVEEAEASDSFPALGYPAGLGSQLGSGDFSDDMRRGGATGDDWSDWEAHLPGSPDSSSSTLGGGNALHSLDSLDCSGSGHPSGALAHETSDKFEASEGEDEELQRMAWVADNLQQELLAADAARMAADELVRERSAVVQSLQARVQEAVSALADLDEQVADAHAALQAHLAQQLAVQDALRQHEEETRETRARTLAVDATIQERGEEMAALASRAAEMRAAAQAAAAAEGKPPAAGAAASASPAERQARPRSGGSRQASSSGKSRRAAERDAGGSPRSDMSSPWGTDVSGSEAEDDEREEEKRPPSQTKPLSWLTGSRPSSAGSPQPDQKCPADQPGTS